MLVFLSILFIFSDFKIKKSTFKKLLVIIPIVLSWYIPYYTSTIIQPSQNLERFAFETNFDFSIEDIFAVIASGMLWQRRPRLQLEALQHLERLPGQDFGDVGLKR